MAWAGSWPSWAGKPEPRQVELTIHVDRAQIRAGSKSTSVGGRTELRDPILRYGVALGITALAAILRGVLGAHFPGLVPFVTFFPAVLAVTLLAGVGPGLLATGFSAYLAWFFWLQPAAELPPPSIVVTLNLILFVLASVLLIVTAEAARRYHGRCLASERRFRAAEDSAFDGFGILEAIRDPGGAITDPLDLREPGTGHRVVRRRWPRRAQAAGGASGASRAIGTVCGLRTSGRGRPA
jgi:hypothetical protein